MSAQNQNPNDDALKQPDQMTPEPTKNDSPIPLPATAEAEIASGLKRLYGQMLAEPMPEKFAGLLEQLAKADRKPEQPT